MNKQSRRGRRMDRHRKLTRHSGLNMISLMDIFTILVFFLLVNSSSSQQLPSQKALKLPTSTAAKAPRETLALVITPNALLVEGREVVRMDSLVADDGIIQPLKAELLFQADKHPVLATVDAAGETTPSSTAQPGRAITILGDENTSYEVLRKILATCQSANYTDVAFAAMQTSNKKRS